MQTRVLNINKMIRNKRIKEVTNFNLEGPGSLFDANIFGYGEARIKTFGFIRLNGHFVHPIFYDISSRVWRDLPLIINGSKTFKIDSKGDLVPDPNGNTGLEWLYENFDKINLKKLEVNENTKISTALMKKTVAKMTRDEFFIDKLLVKPLHFRDIDTSGGATKVDELNEYYMNLLKACNFKQKVSFSAYWNDVKIQGIIQSIFEYFKRQHKKTGLQRAGVMSRTVDNAMRLVITAPEIRMKDTLGNNRYSLGRTTIPLHHFLNGSPTHAIAATKRILQVLFEMGKYPQSTQEEFDYFFNEDYIEEAINHFHHSHLERLSYVKDKYGDVCELFFEFTDEKTKAVTKEKRGLTWTDLFYIALHLYKDNIRTMITRYPVTGKGSNQFFKPDVSVFTSDTGDVKIFINENDPEPIWDYKENYPNISKYLTDTSLLDRMFDETARVSNLTLPDFNGDYD